MPETSTVGLSPCRAARLALCMAGYQGTVLASMENKCPRNSLARLQFPLAARVISMRRCHACMHMIGALRAPPCTLDHKS